MNQQPPAEAVIHEWSWKTAAMSRMTVAVLRLALARPEFSANDLPEDLEHGGQGIAGSVIKWLKTDGIIERVMVGTQPRFVYNAGKNPIGVYRLKSFARATSLLERHLGGESPRPTAEPATHGEQLEMV